MTNRKREILVDNLQGFERQADIAIKTARRVRKALQAGADDKAERECGGLDFAIPSLNDWIGLLPKARLLNKTCSQCKFFSSDNCKLADAFTLGNADACEHFSLRKGEQR